MIDLLGAFEAAAHLILSFDPELAQIVGLSLSVSLIAVALGAVVGLPLGAAVAVFAFPGRRGVAILLSALMGLPPVVVGLIVYLMLSRAGPLGALGLLFTPTAMVIAQAILVTPIIASISRQIVEDMWTDYAEPLHSLGASPLAALATLLWDGRVSLMTGLLAGFGRATAEVGAVMIVGGNIAHVTRVMTTAIALETSKGDLALALGLGLILITLSLLINGAAFAARGHARGDA
jgi:tungstate transport system permease protein